MLSNIQKYDYAVCVGRFSPIHNGHIELINEAQKNANKIIVLIGSCFKPRDIKNPFTGDERQSMISLALNDIFYHESKTSNFLSFGQLRDFIYNDIKWVIQVQNMVEDIIKTHGNNPDKVSICLVGAKKDNSSYYLNMFPEWDFIEYSFKETNVLSATDIREKLFTVDTNKHEKFIKPYVHEKVFTFIESCFKNDWFKNLILEYDYIKKYKESWSKSPYAPIFITTDTIVLCSNHILMIKRKNIPGKGLLALPGGFLNSNERIIDGAIRELQEETNIEISEQILKRSIIKEKVIVLPLKLLLG